MFSSADASDRISKCLRQFRAGVPILSLDQTLCGFWKIRQAVLFLSEAGGVVYSSGASYIYHICYVCLKQVCYSEIFARPHNLPFPTSQDLFFFSEHDAGCPSLGSFELLALKVYIMQCVDGPCIRIPFRGTKVLSLEGMVGDRVGT